MQDIALRPKQTLSESLETRIIAKPTQSDIEDAVRILNSTWGNFYTVTPEIMTARFESRQLFIGCYQKGKLVGILETLALQADVGRFDAQTPEDNVRLFLDAIKPQVETYAHVTHKGYWRQMPRLANALLLIDITVDNSLRNNGAAPKMIEFGKQLLLEKKDPRLHTIDYVLTFTPDNPIIKRWHKKLWAFDTKFTVPHARPGYNPEQVNFMCYMAPGYKPKLGMRG